MRDLEIVIPAYNEEACIAEVVGEWLDMLTGLGVEFRMLVLDDGSTDGTRSALEAFAGEPRVEVVSKANAGHGPTILTGYRQAVADAEWVFQCDADGEMPTSAFPELWRMRDTYDAIFGTRLDRKQSTGRRTISAVSRLVVHLAFAQGVEDVNTPYRLMRSSVLAPILPRIPDTTFAPNLAIAGALSAGGARIANVPVPHVPRQTGTVSIVRWGLVRAAVRSLVQTIALAPRLRRLSLPVPAPTVKRSA